MHIHLVTNAEKLLSVSPSETDTYPNSSDIVDVTTEYVAAPAISTFASIPPGVILPNTHAPSGKLASHAIGNIQSRYRCASKITNTTKNDNCEPTSAMSEGRPPCIIKNAKHHARTLSR